MEVGSEYVPKSLTYMRPTNKWQWNDILLWMFKLEYIYYLIKKRGTVLFSLNIIFFIFVLISKIFITQIIIFYHI